MESIISGNDSILNALYSLHGKSDVQQGLKPSQYNYFQKCAEGYLVYNTLYNTLMRITKTEYSKIIGEKSIGKDLTRILRNNGILVDQEVNEFKLYTDWAKAQRKISKPYLSFNIATTLKCNARCSYCYEKGIRKASFPAEQQKQLVQFIISRLHEDDRLILNWFGGEPLLAQNVIDYVTDELKKADISFSSYLITNGSLINKKLVDAKFGKWKVNDVQITLDGLAKTYAERKSYINQRNDIFHRLLKKINTIAASGVRVHIRLNIDRKNSDEILDLLQVLEEKFDGDDNITWYPAFLTGIGDDLTSDEKRDFIKKMFIRMHNPTKMSAARRLHSMPKIRACMRNDPRSISIDVGGNVYSCEHLVGRKSEAIGTLSCLDNKLNEKRSTMKLNKECRNCVFLPKCMGGCVSNLETGDELCMIEKYMIQGYLAYMADR